MRSIYRTVADRPVSTLIPLHLENRLWNTVVLFHCCTLIWGLTNNNYNLYLLQFMTVTINIRSCYICIPYLSIYSWIVEQIGIYDIHISSAEGQTLLKATHIWLFAFCVVLIQIIVILKKRGGYILKVITKLYVARNDDTTSLTVMIWNILRMLLTIWF